MTLTSADDKALAEIGKLKNLKILKISSNTAITGKCLLQPKGCKYLKTLDVTGCELTLSDFDEIRISQIKTLSVSGNCFSDLEKRKLKMIFPDAKIIDSSNVDSATKFLFAPLH